MRKALFPLILLAALAMPAQAKTNKPVQPTAGVSLSYFDYSDLGNEPGPGVSGSVGLHFDDVIGSVDLSVSAGAGYSKTPKTYTNTGKGHSESYGFGIEAIFNGKDDDNGFYMGLSHKEFGWEATLSSGAKDSKNGSSLCVALGYLGNTTASLGLSHCLPDGTENDASDITATIGFPLSKKNKRLRGVVSLTQVDFQQRYRNDILSLRRRGFSVSIGYRFGRPDYYR